MYKTVAQISRIYGQSESSIRKWIREGRLKAYRPDKRTLVKAEDFETFMESAKIRAAQDADVMTLLKEFCT